MGRLLSNHKIVLVIQIATTKRIKMRTQKGSQGGKQIRKPKQYQ